MGRRNHWKNLAICIAFVTVYVMFRNCDTKMEIKQTPEINNGNNGFDFFVDSRQQRTFKSKAEEMNERTARMRRVCSQYPKHRQLYKYMKGSLFYISNKYNLSYCRVAKVGSTFWTQAFLTISGFSPKQIAHAQNTSSLFNLPRDESHEAIKEHKELTMGLDDPRIHQTTSFLVGRNPYSRLFSSYIDQIFLPNKWFLASYMLPKTKDKKRQMCGNNVSFESFLKTITDFISKETLLDLHWAPIFSICKPCSTKIDILAKQETFNEDTKYILDTVGVDQGTRDDIDNSLKDGNQESAVTALVHTYVTKAHDRSNVKKGCISEAALAERLWAAFQIQGHIHNDVPFPADKFSSSSKAETEERLSKLVQEVLKEKRLTSAEKENQRREWKQKYWNQITPETLQKVQDMFFEDFIVFGYDLDPNTI